MYIKRKDKLDDFYNALQAKSVEMVQQLSGNRWTDFNEHDPGVTFLDASNYALLELDYKLSFAFEAYLTAPEHQPSRYDKLGLFSSDKLFSNAIVTPQDYERLMMDEVKGLQHCQCQLEGNNYRIAVVLEPGFDFAEVKQQIVALYHQHRNLCENLGQVKQADWWHARPAEDRVHDDIHYKTNGGEQPERRTFEPGYRSIQYDLPNCYGVNHQGPPTGASPQVQAQILQLKAYLSVFDFLIAGVDQQVANISKLLTLTGEIPQGDMPTVSFENATELIDQERFEKTALVKETLLHEQKSYYFDLLDSLYGEDTREMVKKLHDDLPKANRERAKLIELLPLLNQNRFRSFNLMDKQLSSVPALKITIMALLGHELKEETSVTNRFSRYNINLVSDAHFFNDLKGWLNVEFLLEDLDRNWAGGQLARIPRIALAYDERKIYLLKHYIHLLRHNVLYESFLEKGTDPANYRSLLMKDAQGYLLIYHESKHEKWINLGYFTSKEALIEIANRLWDLLDLLNRESMSFYLVEHNLLLSRHAEQPFSNRLTIVIPQWTERFYQRDDYLNLFRERLPAHLMVYYRWLNPEDMRKFEELYFNWRSAWAESKQEEIALFSHQLKKML